MRAILLAVSFFAVVQAQAGDTKTWDPKQAAVYLDGRMDWWESWQPAARDHDTFCVSCHTALTYALARPALRSTLEEKEPNAVERKLLANVSKRVSLWQDVQAYYSDKSGPGKSAESRSSEAVLNALVLARAQSPAAPDALRAMFALQLKTGDVRGSWNWMNFHYEPWEAGDSGFWGATLAGLAVGWAPESFRADPAIQEDLDLLAEYLRREQDCQATLNRAVALWAAGKLPRLLKPEQREAIVAAIAAQQRDDGGWNTASLAIRDWKRVDGTALDTASDGYATGLMVVALEQSGVASAKGPAAKGRAWLLSHQDASGAWLSVSLNKKRDPQSDAGRFMTDAATAYAVMALSDR